MSEPKQQLQVLASEPRGPSSSAKGQLRRDNLVKSLAETPTLSATRDGTGTAKADSALGTANSSRNRTTGREDEGDATEEGTDEGMDELETFGNMKANLVWDCTGRRLCLSARQYVESPRKLELKLKGMLDTASGQHRAWGHVRRNFYTHVPLLQRLLTVQAQRQSGSWVDEPNLDPDAFLPGGLRCLLFQDWILAPGVSYDTARSPPLPPSASGSGVAGGATAGLPTLLAQRIRYQVALKKNPQALKNGPKGDLWLAAKALAEFDPKASEVTLGASLRLKAMKYGITGAQDLRVSMGLDLTQDLSGRLSKLPYFHISDGKLGARLHNRRWQLTYTL